MPRFTFSVAMAALAVAVGAFRSPAALADDVLPAPAAAEAAPAPLQQPPIIVTADALPVGSKQVATSYEGSWNGFDTLNIAVAATITPKAYAVVANLSPNGLTELTNHLRKSTTYEARSSGQITEAGDAKPVYYFHHGGKRGREVELNFSSRGVVTKARPTFGDFGDPPATPSQKREAIDSLTAAIVMATADTQVCNRTLKIFDGKARYNLTLSPDGKQKIRTPGYKGEALKCKAVYTRIAGYDKPRKKDKPLVEKPFTIWFAPAPNGLHIPARIKIDSNFGPISVTLQSMNATAVL